MHIPQLKELGLSDGQIRVYEVLLEQGSSRLNRIQEKTGIDRRNIYDILNTLIERGFVTYILEQGAKTYQVSDLEKLSADIAVKKSQLDALEYQLPDIQSLLSAQKSEIRAEVVRGSEAMKTFLESTFSHGDTYWIGGNSGVYTVPGMQYWFDHWMDRRAQKKCKMFDLVDANKSLKGLPADDFLLHKSSFYERRELPTNFSSPMVILISGNRVAQILWNAQPFCCVFEGKEVRESFMKYFEYFWEE